MGKWLDAADSVSPRTVPISDFQRFLDGLPPDERAEMDEVIKRAMQIDVGKGRYSYIRDVIVAGGGKKFDTQAISRALNRGAK